MRCIQRCLGCPGQSDPEYGPLLCDNPLEDCAKFHPETKPHQFVLTTGPIKTSHQVLCRNCGYIYPWVPLDSKSIAYCVLCGYTFQVRKLK